MARNCPLPENLSPAQVVALQDALLANADRLLRSALATLDAGDAPLARSLAILGMEESGKAIALHERRAGMAFAQEGEPFVDERLQRLWGLHGHKLEVVHGFLVQEQYWFGVEPSDPEENALALGAIDEWKRDHNVLKQRGFYVDVSPLGSPLVPGATVDPDAVRAVIGHVHQIGWQLRLGEHIEWRGRMSRETDIPAATEHEIKTMRELLKRADPEVAEAVLESMRTPKQGAVTNNIAYAFVPPDEPFANVGKPGYEAQDRELLALTLEAGLVDKAGPEN